MFHAKLSCVHRCRKVFIRAWRINKDSTHTYVLQPLPKMRFHEAGAIQIDSNPHRCYDALCIVGEFPYATSRFVLTLNTSNLLNRHSI
jgi:hypothetical protein